MKQRVLAGRIMVDPVEVEKKTGGGIIIPENASKRPTEGTVVIRGDDLIEVKMEIREGDFVVFPEGVGREVEIDEHKYLLMKQDDILYYTRN